MRLKRIVAATAVLSFAFVLVGCSSDSDSKSSSSTTTSKDAVCSDKTALTDSVKKLTSSDTLTGGKSGIQDQADQVKKNLDALGDSVKADLKPQVDDVKSAVSDLESAVKDAGNGSITGNIQAIGTAIAKVGSTAGDLFSSLNTECPSS